MNQSTRDAPQGGRQRGEAKGPPRSGTTSTDVDPEGHVDTEHEKVNLQRRKRAEIQASLTDSVA